MNEEQYKHRAIVSKIHDLMRDYESLPPQTKKEILSFLKTPDLKTELALKKPNNGNSSLFVMV